MKYKIWLPMVDHGADDLCMDLIVYIEAPDERKAIALAAGHSARCFQDPRIVLRPGSNIGVQGGWER